MWTCKNDFYAIPRRKDSALNAFIVNCLCQCQCYHSQLSILICGLAYLISDLCSQRGQGHYEAGAFEGQSSSIFVDNWPVGIELKSLLRNIMKMYVIFFAGGGCRNQQMKMNNS